MHKNGDTDTLDSTKEPVETNTSSQDSKAPENRLKLAILKEALVVYQRGLSSTSPVRIRRGKEAAKWFMSNDDDWPFSFLNICRDLSIDAEYIRAGLKKLKKDANRRKRIVAFKKWLKP